MKTIQLDGVDKGLTVIVQGAMGLLNLDDDEAFACLDAAFAAGIRAFDTGHVYVAGERSVDGLLGAWISARGCRDDVVIMAKGAHPEPPDWTMSRVTVDAVHDDVVDTLRRGALDHLDVWSFHRDDESVAVGDLVAAVNAEIEAGRIGAWGVSNWTSGRLQEATDIAAAAGWAGPVVNSPHYSLVDQLIPQWDDVRTLTGEAGAIDRRWHRSTGLPVVAWSALSGGVLSSNLSRRDFETTDDEHLAGVFRSYDSEANWERRSRAEEVAARLGVALSDVAIAWLLHSDLTPAAVVGGANPDEIRQNAAAAEIELSDADRTYIFDDTESDDPADSPAVQEPR